jgi:hypothetical protein
VGGDEGGQNGYAEESDEPDVYDKVVYNELKRSVNHASINQRDY